MTDIPIYIDENILYPPFTFQKCVEFAEHAGQNGKNVLQYGENRYAIAENEIMGTKDVEIDVPDYDDEGNPIMIEYEDTEVVIDYDEEGNPTGSHEITVIKHKQQTHKETVTIPYPVVDPDYEEKQADRREAEFNKAFFNTSFGYIRRAVTMKDGSKKDFLADLLLQVKAGLEMGLDVKILTYDKPSFDADVSDWEEYQHEVSATPQFVTECLLQTVADFRRSTNENTANIDF